MEQLKSLASAISNKQELIAGFQKSLSNFGILPHKLESNAYEMEVLLPEDAVGRNLESVGEELKNIDDLMMPFHELLTGSRESFKISSISSSDITFAINVDVDLAQVLSIVFLALYIVRDKIGSYRTKAAELAQFLSKDHKILEEIKNEEKNIIDDSLQKLVEAQLGKAHKKIADDEGRRNELRTAISKAARKLLDKMSQGIAFDLHAGPPPESAEGPEGEGKTAPDADRVKHTAIAKNIAEIKILDERVRAYLPANVQLHLLESSTNDSGNNSIKTSTQD